jgi:hypothetical protein
MSCGGMANVYQQQQFCFRHRIQMTRFVTSITYYAAHYTLPGSRRVLLIGLRFVCEYHDRHLELKREFDESCTR